MQLIKGKDLTEAQKENLNFNGMNDSEWVNSHAFYFENGEPATKKGFYYPVSNPSKKLLAEFSKAEQVA
jgi:hypothetical protein